VKKHKCLCSRYVWVSSAFHLHIMHIHISLLEPNKSKQQKELEVQVIGIMPIIVAIPIWNEAQRGIAGGALDWCLCLALSAPQTTCSAVSTDVHRLVMCCALSRWWSRSASCCCQLINECLPKGLPVHGYLSFAFCDVLLNEERIHHSYVHKVIKKVVLWITL